MNKPHLAQPLAARLAKVDQALSLTGELYGQLADLGDLERWSATRLVSLEQKTADLYNLLGAILNISDIVTPVVVLPIPTVRPGVDIRVGHLIEVTKFGASLYSMPGMVGGYFKSSSNGKVCKRRDGSRHFPADAIIGKYDPVTRTIRVTISWYNEGQQQDLRDYISNHSKISTPTIAISTPSITTSNETA